MSALATIFGSLGELSESELRQLYLAIGVRLGIPDVPPGPKAREKGRGKTSNTKQRGGKTSASAAPSGKGNPNRKSQWANHPLYKEYSRLKKVVESQAKEGKTSFNAVDTAESRAYRVAFTQWVEAKSSFRGHGESGAIRSRTAKEEESEEDSEEGDDGRPSYPPANQRSVGSPPRGTNPAAGKPSSSPPPRNSGKGKSPAK